MSSFACKGTSYCLFHHVFSFFLFPHEEKICSLSHHFMLFDKMLPKRSLSTAKMLLSIITTVPHCKLSSIGDSMTNVCFAIFREIYKKMRKTYSNYLCHINLTICRFNIIHILYCLKLYTKLFFVITKIPKSCVRINHPYYFF